MHERSTLGTWSPLQGPPLSSVGLGLHFPTGGPQHRPGGFSPKAGSGSFVPCPAVCPPLSLSSHPLSCLPTHSPGLQPVIWVPRASSGYLPTYPASCLPCIRPSTHLSSCPPVHPSSLLYHSLSTSHLSLPCSSCQGFGPCCSHDRYAGGGGWRVRCHVRRPRVCHGL